jgi:hypothetical protein
LCAAFILAAGALVQTAEPPFPVNISVDAALVTGPLRPIWRYFGADEPNYATMKDGQRSGDASGVAGGDRRGRWQGDAGIHTAAPGCVTARRAVALSRAMASKLMFAVVGELRRCE